MRRVFAHPDGRTYEFEVVDCRLHETWRDAKGKAQGNTSTRKSDEDALAGGEKKARELAKKGYVEGASAPSLFTYARDADLVDGLRSDVDYKGAVRRDYQPAGANVYAYENIVARGWLVTSDDRRRGIALGGAAKTMDEATARAALDEILARRAEVFADERTPLRKFPAKIGRFTHLVVLSPVVTDKVISRDVNIANHAYARSVFDAFPSFACETIGDETVAVAEARTRGHGALGTGRWDRAPHPVFDLAIRKKPKDEPDFLVHDPATLGRLGLGAFPFAKGEILARNWANEIRRVEPTTDLAELRAWLGFAT